MPPEGPNESSGIAARGPQRFARPHEAPEIPASRRELAPERVSTSRRAHESPEVPASRRDLPLHMRPQRVAGPRVARGPSESSGPRVARERVVAPRVARDPSESAGIARARAEIRASRRELPRPEVPASRRELPRPRSWPPAAPPPCSRKSCAAFNLGHSISHQMSKDAATDDDPCRRCVGRQSGRNAGPCRHCTMPPLARE